MKLYYSKVPNFGDRLNEVLWPSIFGDVFDENPLELFIGIGTLLNSKIPLTGKKIVFGAGYGYGEIPLLDNKFEIYCVRGHMTADALNIDRKLAITDPAILVAPYLPQSGIEMESNILLIPHHLSAEFGDWDNVARMLGWSYLDPKLSVKEVLQRIAAAKLVVTEAMHGAILADAYRIPWVAYKAYDHINEFKWQDWCSSVKMKFEPARIPAIWNPYRTSTPAQRFKVGVKRLLLSSGCWRKNWDKPFPVKSKSKIYDEALLRLSSLCKYEALSSDSVHTYLLEKMLVKSKLVSARIQAVML